MKITALFVTSLCWIGSASAQQLYYTNGSGLSSQIGRAGIDGSNQTTLISSGLNGADGIRLDVAGGKLYWAEQGGNIQRANIDGTNVELLVAAGGNPHAVSLDLIAGKVYWTEVAGNRIRRANLDGSNIELVTNLNSPDGIVVDPVGAKVYWSRGNVVRRANLDGSSNELLYTSGSPHGLALDTAAGKVYWTNFGNGRVQRGDMDGSGPLEDLVTGLATPLDIALDLIPGKMYWTELSGGGSLKRANLDGTNIETVLGAGLSGPFGIALSPTTLPTTVPALPTLGLVALSTILMLAGAAMVHRRTRSTAGSAQPLR